MVPEGAATRQTKLNVQGIHANPVSGNLQAPSHWDNIGKYNTYHGGEGGKFSKITVKQCEVSAKMTWHPKPSCKHMEPQTTPPATHYTNSWGKLLPSIALSFNNLA